jgi:mannose-6-phosphate isomerase-like protein (cupin superfamily)
MELHKHSEITTKEDEFFKVLATTDKSQVALMRLLPDGTSGEYGNEHPGSDQILIVMEGRGHAKIDNKTVELEEGDVLVIKAGEKHQVIADGAVSLHTMNVYSPVAYSKDGHAK